MVKSVKELFNRLFKMELSDDATELMNISF